MPNVVVYVPASIWRKLESQHGEGAAAEKVREFARQGWETLRDGSDSGAATTTLRRGSVTSGEYPKGESAAESSVAADPAAAPDSHFRPDPKPVRK